MSLAQYEARQSSALIQYDRRVSTSKPTTHNRLGLAIAAMAIVPAVFWASLAWFVWGWLGAVIAATVVLVVSTFTMALVRSASGIETPALLPINFQSSGRRHDAVTHGKRRASSAADRSPTATFLISP